MSLRYLFVCVVVLLSACSFQQQNSVKKIESNFFTDNVELEDLCLISEYKKVQLACHRIYNGKGTVLAIRIYLKSKESEPAFRKITVLLPTDLKVGEKFDIDNQSVKAYLSHGLSFGVGKAGGVGSAIGGSVIILSKTNTEINATLNLQFQMKSPLNWPNKCGSENVAQTLEFKYSPFDSLTPWDGRLDVSNKFLSESYPQ